LKNVGPADAIDWSDHPKLETLYTGRKAKDMTAIVPIEHMISAIAYKVADYLNKSTNFGEAAADILNHSALVQMYTDASETKDTISITGFTAVYPSETVTGVLLDASKAYMSTQGKGNFTFKILKNGAKETDMPDTEQTATKPVQAKASTVDLDTQLAKRSDIKASGLPKPLSNEKALGRKRQR